MSKKRGKSLNEILNEQSDFESLDDLDDGTLPETEEKIDFRKLNVFDKSDAFTTGNTYDVNYSVYDDDISVTANSLDQLEHKRADAQNGITQLALAIPRIGIGAALKTAQGLGFVGSLAKEIVTNPIGIWEKELRTVLDEAGDNYLSNVSTNAEDTMKDFFHVYKSGKYDSGSLLSQIGTTAFWADDASDGIAFALSAYAPGGALGKLGKAINLGAKGLKATQLIGSTGYNTIVESMQEAVDSKKSIMSELSENINERGFATDNEINYFRESLKKNQQELGLSDYELDAKAKEMATNYYKNKPYTELQKKQLASEGAATVMQGNLAALLLSNAASAYFMHGLPKANIRKLRANAFNGTVKPEDISVFKETMTGIGKGMASEAFYEENIQLAMQNYAKEKALTGEGDFTDVFGNMIDNFSTFEGRKSMFLGGVIGLAMGGRREYLDAKEKRNTVDEYSSDKKRNEIKTELETADNLFHDSMKQFLRSRDTEIEVTNEDGTKSKVMKRTLLNDKGELELDLNNLNNNIRQIVQSDDLSLDASSAIFNKDEDKLQYSSILELGRMLYTKLASAAYGTVDEAAKATEAQLDKYFEEVTNGDENAKEALAKNKEDIAKLTKEYKKMDEALVFDRDITKKMSVEDIAKNRIAKKLYYLQSINELALNKMRDSIEDSEANKDKIANLDKAISDAKVKKAELLNVKSRTNLMNQYAVSKNGVLINKDKSDRFENLNDLLKTRTDIVANQNKSNKEKSDFDNAKKQNLADLDIKLNEVKTKLDTIDKNDVSKQEEVIALTKDLETITNDIKLKQSDTYKGTEFDDSSLLDIDNQIAVLSLQIEEDSKINGENERDLNLYYDAMTRMAWDKPMIYDEYERYGKSILDEENRYNEFNSLKTISEKLDYIKDDMFTQKKLDAIKQMVGDIETKLNEDLESSKEDIASDLATVTNDKEGYVKSLNLVPTEGMLAAMDNILENDYNENVFDLEVPFELVNQDGIQDIVYNGIATAEEAEAAYKVLSTIGDKVSDVRSMISEQNAISKNKSKLYNTKPLKREEINYDDLKKKYALSLLNKFAYPLNVFNNNPEYSNIQELDSCITEAEGALVGYEHRTDWQFPKSNIELTKDEFISDLKELIEDLYSIRQEVLDNSNNRTRIQAESTQLETNRDVAFIDLLVSLNLLDTIKSERIAALLKELKDRTSNIEKSIISNLILDEVSKSDNIAYILGALDSETSLSKTEMLIKLKGAHELTSKGFIENPIVYLISNFTKYFEVSDSDRISSRSAYNEFIRLGYIDGLLHRKSELVEKKYPGLLEPLSRYAKLLELKNILGTTIDPVERLKAESEAKKKIGISPTQQQVISLRRIYNLFKRPIPDNNKLCSGWASLKGVAGTGKSTLAKYLINMLGFNLESQVLLCGTKEVHANNLTNLVHGDNKQKGITVDNLIKSVITDSVKLIIIDEAMAMSSNQFLELARKIRDINMLRQSNNQELVRVLMMGDPNQLTASERPDTIEPIYTGNPNLDAVIHIENIPSLTMPLRSELGVINDIADIFNNSKAKKVLELQTKYCSDIRQGVNIVRDSHDLINEIKSDKNSTKKRVLLTTRNKIDKYKKELAGIIPESDIYLYEDYQGLSSDIVYLDIESSDVSHQGNVFSEKTFNSAMYTSISRATGTVHIVSSNQKFSTSIVPIEDIISSTKNSNDEILKDNATAYSNRLITESKLISSLLNVKIETVESTVKPADTVTTLDEPVPDDEDVITEDDDDAIEDEIEDLSVTEDGIVIEPEDVVEISDKTDKVIHSIKHTRWNPFRKRNLFRAVPVGSEVVYSLQTRDGKQEIVIYAVVDNKTAENGIGKYQEIGLISNYELNNSSDKIIQYLKNKISTNVGYKVDESKNKKDSSIESNIILRGELLEGSPLSFNYSNVAIDLSKTNDNIISYVQSKYRQLLAKEFDTVEELDNCINNMKISLFCKRKVDKLTSYKAKDGHIYLKIDNIVVGDNTYKSQYISLQPKHIPENYPQQEILASFLDTIKQIENETDFKLGTQEFYTILSIYKGNYSAGTDKGSCIKSNDIPLEVIIKKCRDLGIDFKAKDAKNLEIVHKAFDNLVQYYYGSTNKIMSFSSEEKAKAYLASHNLSEQVYKLIEQTKGKDRVVYNIEKDGVLCKRYELTIGQGKAQKALNRIARANKYAVDLPIRTKTKDRKGNDVSTGVPLHHLGGWSENQIKGMLYRLRTSLKNKNTDLPQLSILFSSTEEGLQLFIYMINGTLPDNVYEDVFKPKGYTDVQIDIFKSIRGLLSQTEIDDVLKDFIKYKSLTSDDIDKIVHPEKYTVNDKPAYLRIPIIKGVADKVKAKYTPYEMSVSDINAMLENEDDRDLALSEIANIFDIKFESITPTKASVLFPGGLVNDDSSADTDSDNKNENKKDKPVPGIDSITNDIKDNALLKLHDNEPAIKDLLSNPTRLNFIKVLDTIFQLHTTSEGSDKVRYEVIYGVLSNIAKQHNIDVKELQLYTKDTYTIGDYITVLDVDLKSKSGIVIREYQNEIVLLSNEKEITVNKHDIIDIKTKPTISNNIPNLKTINTIYDFIKSDPERIWNLIIAKAEHILDVYDKKAYDKENPNKDNEPYVFINNKNNKNLDTSTELYLSIKNLKSYLDKDNMTNIIKEITDKLNSINLDCKVQFELSYENIERNKNNITIISDTLDSLLAIRNAINEVIEVDGFIANGIDGGIVNQLKDETKASNIGFANLNVNDKGKIKLSPINNVSGDKHQWKRNIELSAQVHVNQSSRNDNAIIEDKVEQKEKVKESKSDISEDLKSILDEHNYDYSNKSESEIIKDIITKSKDADLKRAIRLYNKSKAYTKVTNTKEGNYISSKRVLRLIKKHIPDIKDSDIQFVESVMIESIIGEKKKALYYNGKLLFDMATGKVKKGVVYHELFHKLWDRHLTHEEKRKITNAIRRRYSEELKVLDTIDNQLEKQIFLEEFMANKFQEFAINKTSFGTWLNSIFTKLLNWIGVLKDNKNQLDKIFDELFDRQFTNKSDISNKNTLRAMEQIEDLFGSIDNYRSLLLDISAMKEEFDRFGIMHHGIYYPGTEIEIFREIHTNLDDKKLLLEMDLDEAIEAQDMQAKERILKDLKKYESLFLRDDNGNYYIYQSIITALYKNKANDETLLESLSSELSDLEIAESLLDTIKEHSLYSEITETDTINPHSKQVGRVKDFFSNIYMPIYISKEEYLKAKENNDVVYEDELGYYRPIGERLSDKHAFYRMMELFKDCDSENLIKQLKLKLEQNGNNKYDRVILNKLMNLITNARSGTYEIYDKEEEVSTSFTMREGIVYIAIPHKDKDGNIVLDKIINMNKTQLKDLVSSRYAISFSREANESTFDFINRITRSITNPNISKKELESVIKEISLSWIHQNNKGLLADIVSLFTSLQKADIRIGKVSNKNGDMEIEYITGKTMSESGSLVSYIKSNIVERLDNAYNAAVKEYVDSGKEFNIGSNTFNKLVVDKFKLGNSKTMTNWDNMNRYLKKGTIAQRHESFILLLKHLGLNPNMLNNNYDIDLVTEETIVNDFEGFMSRFEWAQSDVKTAIGAIVLESDAGTEFEREITSNNMLDDSSSISRNLAEYLGRNSNTMRATSYVRADRKKAYMWSTSSTGVDNLTRLKNSISNRTIDKPEFLRNRFINKFYKHNPFTTKDAPIYEVITHDGIKYDNGISESAVTYSDELESDWAMRKFMFGFIAKAYGKGLRYIQFEHTLSTRTKMVGVEIDICNEKKLNERLVSMMLQLTDRDTRLDNLVDNHNSRDITNFNIFRRAAFEVLHIDSKQIGDRYILDRMPTKKEIEENKARLLLVLNNQLYDGAVRFADRLVDSEVYWDLNKLRKVNSKLLDNDAINSRFLNTSAINEAIDNLRNDTSITDKTELDSRIRSLEKDIDILDKYKIPTDNYIMSISDLRQKKAYDPSNPTENRYVKTFKIGGIETSKQNLLMPSVLAWYKNNYVNNYFIHQLSGGDVASFGGSKSIVKRNQSLYSPGTRPCTLDGFANKKFKVACCKDTKANPIEFVRSLFDNEQDEISILKAYGYVPIMSTTNTGSIFKRDSNGKILYDGKDYKPNDGMGLMFDDRWYSLESGLGSSYGLKDVMKPLHYEITPERKYRPYVESSNTQVKEVTKKDPITNTSYTERVIFEFDKELNDYIETDRVVKTERYANETYEWEYIKSATPVLLKYASFRVTDAIIKRNPRLVALRTFAVRYGIDELVYGSAIKVGATKNMLDLDYIMDNFTEAESNIEFNISTIIELSNAYYRMQLNPFHELDNTTALPTQLMFILNEAAPDVAASIYSNLAKMIKYGGEVYDSKIKSFRSTILNELSGQENEMLRYLMEDTEITKARYDELSTNSDMKNYIKHDTKEDKYYLKGLSINHPYITTKVGIHASALLNRMTVKLKFPGDKLVLRSTVGTKWLNEEDKAKGSKLTYEIDENGNLFYQVLLPKGALDKREQKAVEQGGLYMYADLLGFRIPSSGLHSAVPLKVVGFYDNKGTNAIIAPDILVPITGWDFDVDSLFTIRRHFPKSKISILSTKLFNDKVDKLSKDLDIAWANNKNEILKSTKNETHILKAIDTIKDILIQIKSAYLKLDDTVEISKDECEELFNEYLKKISVIDDYKKAKDKAAFRKKYAKTFSKFSGIKYIVHEDEFKSKLSKSRIKLNILKSELVLNINRFKQHKEFKNLLKEILNINLDIDNKAPIGYKAKAIKVKSKEVPTKVDISEQSDEEVKLDVKEDEIIKYVFDENYDKHLLSIISQLDVVKDKQQIAQLKELLYRYYQNSVLESMLKVISDKKFRKYMGSPISKLRLEKLADKLKGNHIPDLSDANDDFKMFMSNFQGRAMTGVSANNMKKSMYKMESGRTELSNDDFKLAESNRTPELRTVTSSSKDKNGNLIESLVNYSIVINGFVYNRMSRNELNVVDGKLVKTKEKIIDTYDSLTNVSIDNVKDQIIYVLNYNGKTGNMYSILIDHGVSLDLIVAMMTQPAVIRYSNLRGGKGKSLVKVMDEIKNKLESLVPGYTLGDTKLNNAINLNIDDVLASNAEFEDLDLNNLLSDILNDRLNSYTTNTLNPISKDAIVKFLTNQYRVLEFLERVHYLSEWDSSITRILSILNSIPTMYYDQLSIIADLNRVFPIRSSQDEEVEIENLDDVDYEDISLSLDSINTDVIKSLKSRVLSSQCPYDVSGLLHYPHLIASLAELEKIIKLEERTLRKHDVRVNDFVKSILSNKKNININLTEIGTAFGIKDLKNIDLVKDEFIKFVISSIYDFSDVKAVDVIGKNKKGKQVVRKLSGVDAWVYQTLIKLESLYKFDKSLINDGYVGNKFIKGLDIKFNQNSKIPNLRFTLGTDISSDEIQELQAEFENLRNYSQDEKGNWSYSLNTSKEYTQLQRDLTKLSALLYGLKYKTSSFTIAIPKQLMVEHDAKIEQIDWSRLFKSLDGNDNLLDLFSCNLALNNPDKVNIVFDKPEVTGYIDYGDKKAKVYKGSEIINDITEDGGIKEGRIFFDLKLDSQNKSFPNYIVKNHKLFKKSCVTKSNTYYQELGFVRYNGYYHISKDLLFNPTKIEIYPAIPIIEVKGTEESIINPIPELETGDVVMLKQSDDVTLSHTTFAEVEIETRTKQDGTVVPSGKMKLKSELTDKLIAKIEEKKKQFQNISREEKIEKKNKQKKASREVLTKLLNTLSNKWGVSWVEDNTIQDKAMIINGVVRVNFELATLDTPFHEFIHPFIRAIKENDRALYNSLTDEVKSKFSKVLIDIKELYPDYSEPDQIEEAMVQVLGKLSAAKLGIFNKIFNFIKTRVIGIESDTFKLDSKTKLKNIAVAFAFNKDISTPFTISKNGSVIFEQRVKPSDASNHYIKASELELDKSGNKLEIKTDAIGNQEDTYTNGYRRMTSDTGLSNEFVERVVDRTKTIGEKLATKMTKKYFNKGIIDSNVKLNIPGVADNITYDELVKRYDDMYNLNKYSGVIQHKLKEMLLYKAIRNKYTPASEDYIKYDDLVNQIKMDLNDDILGDQVEMLNLNWILDNEKLVLKACGLTILESVDSKKKTKLYTTEEEVLPEYVISSDELQVATSADLLIRYSDGIFSIKDFKTGKRFNDTVFTNLLKYGNQSMPITDNSRERAKLEIMLRAMMFKYNMHKKGEEISFRDLEVLWMPSENILKQGDVHKAVEVEPFLGMIKEFMKEQYPEVYTKWNNANIFNVSEYTKPSYGFFKATQEAKKNGKSILFNSMTELRRIIRKYPNANSIMFSDKEAAAKCAEHILEAYRDPSVSLSDYKDDISVWEHWLGQMSDTNNPMLQTFRKLQSEQATRATDKYNEVMTIFDKLCQAVYNDYTKHDAKLHKLTRGWLGRVNTIHFWKFAFKSVPISINNPNSPTTMVLVTDTDKEWSSLSLNQKKLLRFVQEQFGNIFSPNGLANKVVTEKEVHGIIKKVTNLDLHNMSVDSGMGFDYNSHKKSFLPKVPVTNQEVRDKYGLISKEILSSTYKRVATMYYEDAFEEWDNSQDALPLKYLGSDSMNISNNYSLDLYNIFSKFMGSCIKKEYMDDVYVVGEGIKNLMELKAKTANSPQLFKKSISMLESLIMNQVLGKPRIPKLTTRIPFTKRGADGSRHQISLYKLIKSLKSFVSLSMLALHPIGGLKNAVFINILSAKESMKGSILKRMTGIDGTEIDFTAKDIGFATTELAKLQADYARGTWKTNKTWLLLRKFDYLSDDEQFGVREEDNIFAGNRLFSMEAMMLPYSRPESWNATIIMLAQLNRLKTKDKNGKDISVYDAYEVVSETKWNETYTTVKWTAPARGKIRNASSSITNDYTELKELTSQEIERLKKVYLRIQGGYRENESSVLQTYLLGDLVLQMKRYLPSILMNNFKSKGTDFALGKYVVKDKDKQTGEDIYEWEGRLTEGKWITLANHVSNIITLGNNPDYKISKLSTDQKSSLIDAYLTTGITIAMLAMYLLAFGDVDDDDSRKTSWFRIIMSFSQQFNPYDLADTIFATPASFKSWNMMKGISYWFWNGLIVRPTGGDWNIDSGINAGHAKGFGDAMKAFPFSPIYKLRNFYLRLDEDIEDNMWKRFR